MIRISSRMFVICMNNAAVITINTIQMPIILFHFLATIFVAHVCKQRKDKHVKIFFSSCITRNHQYNMTI